MSRVLDILKDIDLTDKNIYLKHKDSENPFYKLQALYAFKKLKKLAEKKLNGECVHELNIVSTEKVTLEPRSFIRYAIEVPVYEKCVFCDKGKL